MAERADREVRSAIAEAEATAPSGPRDPHRGRFGPARLRALEISWPERIRARPRPSSSAGVPVATSRRSAWANSGRRSSWSSVGSSAGSASIGGASRPRRSSMPRSSTRRSGPRVRRSGCSRRTRASSWPQRWPGSAPFVEKERQGVQQLLKAAGVQVLFGEAKFTGPRSAELAARDGGRERIDFASAIIATGARPHVVPRIRAGRRPCPHRREHPRARRAPGLDGHPRRWRERLRARRVPGEGRRPSDDRRASPPAASPASSRTCRRSSRERSSAWASSSGSERRRRSSRATRRTSCSASRERTGRPRSRGNDSS